LQFTNFCFLDFSVPT